MSNTKNIKTVKKYERRNVKIIKNAKKEKKT